MDTVNPADIMGGIKNNFDTVLAAEADTAPKSPPKPSVRSLPPFLRFITPPEIVVEKVSENQTQLREVGPSCSDIGYPDCAVLFFEYKQDEIVQTIRVPLPRIFEASQVFRSRMVHLPEAETKTTLCYLSQALSRVRLAVVQILIHYLLTGTYNSAKFTNGRYNYGAILQIWKVARHLGLENMGKMIKMEVERELMHSSLSTSDLVDTFRICHHRFDKFIIEYTCHLWMRDPENLRAFARTQSQDALFLSEDYRKLMKDYLAFDRARSDRYFAELIRVLWVYPNTTKIPHGGSRLHLETSLGVPVRLAMTGSTSRAVPEEGLVTNLELYGDHWWTAYLDKLEFMPEAQLETRPAIKVMLDEARLCRDKFVRGEAFVQDEESVQGEE